MCDFFMWIYNNDDNSNLHTIFSKCDRYYTDADWLAGKILQKLCFNRMSQKFLVVFQLTKVTLHYGSDTLQEMIFLRLLSSVCRCHM